MRRIATAAYLFVGSCLLGLLGCQSLRSADAPLSRLDASTGTTVVIAREPMVFARLDAQFSRSARDYVYLGPAQTNRQGVREYFLWIGVASTLDRGYFAPENELPIEIEIMIQGEPMAFELDDWPPPYLSPESANLYSTPVELQGRLASRITYDQLRLINEARPDRIFVRGADARMRAFSVWTTSSDWADFLN